MNEPNLPAVQESGHLQELARLGSWLALAEKDDQSDKGRGAAAALRLYWAEQLGLAPMAANDIPLIKGRPYVQANVARALAHRAGYRVEPHEVGPGSATAIISLHGEEIGRATFTIEQAREAKIVRPNSAWDTYPDRMLWAKASRYAIADYAPEVLLGIGIVEELGEVIEGEAIDEEDVEPTAVPEPAPAVPA